MRERVADGDAPVGADRQRALPLAHDVIVLQPRAAVLARLDGAAQAVLVQREIGFGAALARQHLAGQPGSPAVGRLVFHGQHEFRLKRLAGALAHRVVEGGGAVPGAEIPSIQHHLRRIHDSPAAAIHHVALALAEARLGEAVAPADVVPVVDMQRQRHEFAGCLLRQPAVGRRAAAAAFRGVQLDQRHGNGFGAGDAFGRVRADREQRCGESQPLQYGGSFHKKHAGPSQVFLGPLRGERCEAALSGWAHYSLQAW